MLPQKYTLSLPDIFREYFSFLSNAVSILEVGCQTTDNLICLQQLGFTKMIGIGTDRATVAVLQTTTPSIKILQGSIERLPFQDDAFDVVYTMGFLTRIPTDQIIPTIQEIVRVSKTFIFGIESFSTNYLEIPEDQLSVREYLSCFQDFDPKIKLIQERFLNYLNEPKMDIAYILHRK